MVRDNKTLVARRVSGLAGCAYWRDVLRVVAFGVCGIAAMAADAERPALTISDDRFVVNGEPRFLVFVAYFDALRASAETLEGDFNFLRAVGVDGIRIFPNWWNWANMRQFPEDTVVDGNGELRPDRLSKLVEVIETAGKHALVVDVSLAYETVGGLSTLREEDLGKSQGALPVIHVDMQKYEKAVASLARHLQSYRHIFIDIQNEFNGRITHLEQEEVARLRDAIKKADPDRLVTASLANEIGPEAVARVSNELGLDVVGWHESRNPWRYDAMDELTRRAKAVTRKPIYLGEPAYMGDEYSVENFITAVSKAKQGGAAAWTFHTQSGFDLSRQPLTALLTKDEKAFLESFKSRVDKVAWGRAGAGA